MENYKKGGLDNRYVVTKSNGGPTDPNADYFVLRLDKDEHAIPAIQAYAEQIKYVNKQLSDEILTKYPKTLKFNIYNNTEYFFSFWDKIKILFGKKVKSHLTIYVDTEVNVLGCKNDAWVEDILPRREKGLMEENIY
jgi:hypothetical protein